jgi:hypothetical protein
MYRYGFGRRRERYNGRRWTPRSRAVGCLLWVVLLIVILVVLALAFGGFQKGTKYSSGAGAAHVAMAAPAITDSGTGVQIAAAGPNGALWFYWASHGSSN